MVYKTIPAHHKLQHLKTIRRLVQISHRQVKAKTKRLRIQTETDPMVDLSIVNNHPVGLCKSLCNPQIWSKYIYIYIYQQPIINPQNLNLFGKITKTGRVNIKPNQTKKKCNVTQRWHPTFFQKCFSSHWCVAPAPAPTAPAIRKWNGRNLAYQLIWGIYRYLQGFSAIPGGFWGFFLYIIIIYIYTIK